jgi:Zn-dependent protease
VPINPSLLKSPRRDMMLVAAAGPGINFLLALLSGALLAIVADGHEEPDFIQKLLSASIYLNALIGVFNLIPIPPLDGGRIAVGLLPARLAIPMARLEHYGMWIVIGILLILPLVTYQLGAEINLFADIIVPIVAAVMDAVSALTGAHPVRWS